MFNPLTNIFFWMIGCFALMIVILLCIVLFIFLAKKTHAMKEFRAFMQGRPIALYFNEHKQVEWMVVSPEAGVVQNEKYGLHIINEEGTYVDTTTRNVIIPFSAEIGSGASVKAFAAADEISEVLKDKKQMGQIRQLLASGALDGAKFEGIRESVNFSELKGLLNTMTPHNLSSLISKSVQHQMGSAGRKEGVAFFWYAILGLGILVIGGVVIYVMTGGGGGTQTVTLDAASMAAAIKYQMAQNASVIAG